MDVVEKPDFYEWWQANFSMANLAMGAAEEAWKQATLMERERCAKWLETYDKGREAEQNTGRYLARKLRDEP